VGERGRLPRFGHEGFFGEDTYAGGADKVSHFIVSFLAARELADVFQLQGHSLQESTALGFGLTALAGLIIELGDGYTSGAAWQDLTVDVLGAGLGLVITRAGYNDVFGLRVGKVPPGVPPQCCNDHSTPPDYSAEVYSADLKIAGLGRRNGWRLGPARYLLLSATYGTKGYGYAIPLAYRERNVGSRSD
jgi:uncharacterized protein YfiM (DUF2279 family)